MGGSPEGLGQGEAVLVLGCAREHGDWVALTGGSPWQRGELLAETPTVALAGRPAETLSVAPAGRLAGTPTGRPADTSTVAPAASDWTLDRLERPASFASMQKNSIAFLSLCFKGK